MMDAETWIMLAGLVLTNVALGLRAIYKLWRKRDTDIAVQGLVPLKYYEQIREGQSKYIAALEERIDSSLELWQKCEEDKVLLKRQLTTVETEVRTLRVELQVATRQTNQRVAKLEEEMSSYGQDTEDGVGGHGPDA